MLENSKAFSSFSVDDLSKAHQFYGTTLGLNVNEDAMGLHLSLSGGSEVFVYAKPNHQPASFTVLNFLVDNIDATVDALVERGVAFEQYHSEMIKTDSKGIARSDPAKGPNIAWFKDPAGNIVAVLQ